MSMQTTISKFAGLKYPVSAHNAKKFLAHLSCPNSSYKRVNHLFRLGAYSDLCYWPVVHLYVMFILGNLSLRLAKVSKMGF